MSTVLNATISAEDTFSDEVQLEGNFNLSVSGTFSGTLTVQRSRDQVNWLDVDTFTEPSEDVGFDPEFNWYRVGCKTGDLASGSIVVRIGVQDTPSNF
jgi:hypothetical protein